MKVSIAWILFAIALLVIIGQQMCNKAAPAASMVPKNQFDALQQRYADTLEGYHQFKWSSDSAIENATSSAIQANELAAQSKQALDQERATNSRLLVKLDSAAKEKPDSSWVKVSPRYQEACDSLRHENLTLNYRILQYEQDAQNQVNALAYESKIRDSALQKERAFNAQFRRQLDACIATGKQQANAGRPRNQLYGGIAAWGNRSNPLGGGEINLALKTPNDAIYEVKGAYLGRWWVGAGTKIKFHF